MRKKINIKLSTGLIGFLIIVLLALLADSLRPYNPLEMDLEKLLEPPSFAHPFGLDENGLDLLAQVLKGARVSLLVSFLVVFISLLVGLLVGSVSAYFGSFWDLVLQRTVDMVLAFPRFLLALAVLAMMGPGLFNLIFAMSLSTWAGFARLVRAEVLHLKKEEYVLSARASGASPFRILSLHIWPNLFGVLLVQAVFSLVAVTVAEAGLGFLGLGVPPEIPTWGKLLSAGRQVLGTAPHLSVFPGLALFFLVLSFQLLGDGLRDFFAYKN